MQCIQNERRRAVIDGSKISCFVNRGKTQEAWRSAWPKIEVDAKSIKRLARRWVEKAKLPVTIN